MHIRDVRVNRPAGFAVGYHGIKAGAAPVEGLVIVGVQLVWDAVVHKIRTEEIPGCGQAIYAAITFVVQIGRAAVKCAPLLARQKAARVTGTS